MNAARVDFSSWDLQEHIASAVQANGWSEPTEIQREAIPLARQGLDVVGQARTGSGKTGAFGIPILERCSPKGTPQAIVLCPTRELAVQVAEEREIRSREARACRFRQYTAAPT
ncbi:MAG: hypothetical protein Ct9H300mP10_03350 [Methanobacteriota archaeon]|nr:MAG: hypothetical protein Ct9H300mP10_03350 [Euryarchaeota archaeon]